MKQLDLDTLTKLTKDDLIALIFKLKDEHNEFIRNLSVRADAVYREDLQELVQLRAAMAEIIEVGQRRIRFCNEGHHPTDWAVEAMVRIATEASWRRARDGAASE